MRFGTQDFLECLTPNTFPGPGGADVCLASKISMHFVGAGIYVSDGGYVLKKMDGKSYFELSHAKIAKLQSQHLIPTPLPAYHLGWFDYLLGYSLWVVLFGVGAIALLKRMFGKLRPFMAERTEPVLGPPVLRTEHDRWLGEELGKRLAPGEHLLHQACVTDLGPGLERRRRWFYVGFTDRRLIFLEVTIGFFLGPTRTITAQSERARDEVRAIRSNGLAIQFDCTDEAGLHFWVLASQRRFTNQWLFARDVPKLVARALGTQAQAQRAAVGP